MSTHFETDFDDSGDDTIHAIHVTQYAQPIKDLESGKAFYRVASGTGAPYQVNFRLADSTGGASHHIDHSSAPEPPQGPPLSLLAAGQTVAFKANVDSPANASLVILLEDGASGTLSSSYPLFAGGAQIGAGAIKANQIVVAIYNDTASPRFDVVGVQGASGTTNLDGLTDVTIVGTPTAGQVLRRDGTDFKNANLAITDVTNLQTSLDAKVGTSRTITPNAPLTGGGNLSANRTISIPPATGSANGYLTSANWNTFNNKQNALTAPGDVPGMTAALEAKQNQSETLDQISAQSMTKGDILVHNGSQVVKMDSGTNGHVLSSDDAAPTGLSWVAQSGGGGGVPTTRQVSTNSPLTGGGALSSDLTLGIPQANGTTDGFLDSADWTTFNGKQNALSAPGDVPGMTSALAAKADLSAGKVPVSQIPTAIPAANIGNGDVDNAELSHLNGVTSSVQNQLNGKAASTHTHAAADITSGQLEVARGGTGADLSATGGAGQVLKQSTAGGAVTVGSLATGDMPSGIDAAKIGSGDVSNVEFGYLANVTSDIQNQIDGIQSANSFAGLSDVDFDSLSGGDIPVYNPTTQRWENHATFSFNELVPVGTVAPFAGTQAPSGWLFCYGQSVNKVEYPKLWDAVKEDLGGGNFVGAYDNGGGTSTTFKLPDLRGRVAAGRDNMGGTSADRIVPGSLDGDDLGASGGSDKHQLTLSEMPQHNHSVTDPGHTHQYYWDQTVRGTNTGDPSPPFADYRGGISNYRHNYTGTTTTGISIGQSGEGQAHNNLQPTLVLNYIIFSGISNIYMPVVLDGQEAVVDLSETGGPGQVLKQNALGGPLSVGALSSEDVSGLTAALAAKAPASVGDVLESRFRTSGNQPLGTTGTSIQWETPITLSGSSLARFDQYDTEILVAGIYAIEAWICFGVQTAGISVNMRVSINGVEMDLGSEVRPHATWSANQISITCTPSLAVGDKVRFRLISGSPGEMWAGRGRMRFIRLK